MRNARRLLRLVNALLDFSRIEAGRMTACFKPVQLYSLTCDIVSVFRAACERGGIALSVTNGDGRAWQPKDTVYVDVEMWEKVCADRNCDLEDLISQIITNLVSNAYKYTLRGAIEVSVTHAHDATPPRAIVRVRDSGCGVSAKDLPRIFERFYRVDKSRARQSGGNGIGLTIAAHLVRAHNGRIWAESDGPGHGATLSFTLPLQ